MPPSPWSRPSNISICMDTESEMFTPMAVASSGEASRRRLASRPCTAKLRNPGAAQQSGIIFFPPIRYFTEFRRRTSKSSTVSQKVTTRPFCSLETPYCSTPASPRASSARHLLTQISFEIDYQFPESEAQLHRINCSITAPTMLPTYALGVAIVTERPRWQVRRARRHGAARRHPPSSLRARAR